MASRPGQEPEEARNRQQGQSRHQHAGDRPGTKGQRQTRLQPALRGGGGAHIRAHRDIHTDEARRARQYRAQHEATGADSAQSAPDDGRDDHADYRYGGILALEIGLRALLNGGGNVAHLRVARRRAQNLTTGDETVDDAQYAKTDGKGGRMVDRIHRPDPSRWGA
jgi:hypothetical protein